MPDREAILDEYQRLSGILDNFHCGIFGVTMHDLQGAPSEDLTREPGNVVDVVLALVERRRDVLRGALTL